MTANLEIHIFPADTAASRSELVRESIGRVPGKDYSSVLYLAPTTLLCDAARRTVHSAAGRCYIPPRIMTLKQFAGRSVRAAAARPVVPRALRPVILAALSSLGMGWGSIVSGLIGELKQAYPLTPPDRLRPLFEELFLETATPEALADRLYGALDSYALYERALAARNAVDEDDAPALAATLAKGGAPLDLLVLDGFYEMTVAEEALAAALIEKAARAVAVIPVSREDDDLSYAIVSGLTERFGSTPALHKPGRPERPLPPYIAARSVEEEVEGIARRIKAGHISGAMRELERITLAVPGLDGYRGVIERVFARYGVPIGFSTPQPLSKARAYRDLLAALQCADEDYPRMAFARVLSSPFFTSIPAALAEAAPRIALDASLVKGKADWLEAMRTNSVRDDGVGVFGALEPLASPPGERPYREWVAAMEEAARALGFTPPQDTREPYARRLADLGMIDGLIGRGITLSEFREALRRVLDFTTSEAEAHAAPGVMAAELLEARGLDPEVLYMGGMRDGDMPRRHEMDLILPDGIRTRLGLVDLRRHLSLQEKVFTRLARAARALHVSYPCMEGDAFYLPSPFIARGERASERVFGVFSPEEELSRLGHRPLASSLHEISGMRRTRPMKSMHVTEVDAYRRCPRRFYIERILALEPSEIREYELEPRELGTVIHRVMENLIPRAEGSLEAFTRAAGEALDEALAQVRIDPYFKRLVRESFLAAAPVIYAVEEGLKAEGYALIHAEHALEGELLPGISLRGKADRIDAGPEGQVEIIDYKTGSQKLSPSGVLKRGESLQLLLYAAMLEAMGHRPSRVGVYSLSDISISWVPGKREQKKGVSLDPYIEAALSYLKETAAALDTGSYPAKPLEDQVCRKCHERPYCPYIQGRQGDAP